MDSTLGVYATLPDLVEFMIWGDEAILKAAASVPAERYMQDFGVSAGSLHKLLLHAMGAQWVWVQRLRRVPSPQFITPEEVPTREALAARWATVHAAVREFVAGQTPEMLATPLTFRNFKGIEFSGTVGQLLMHVTDHATYHRGQQNTLIKMGGGTPVDVFYYQWSVWHGPGKPA
jgi:uncharacterized damage-inducible protein DinB